MDFFIKNQNFHILLVESQDKNNLLNKCCDFVYRKLSMEAAHYSESAAVPRLESELCEQRSSSENQLHIS